MNDPSASLSPALERLAFEIPKVELHLHLEGAIPLETLFSLIQRAGTEPGINSVGDLRKGLAYTDFGHFIEVWTWKNTFIRKEEDFDEIAYKVLLDLAKQNVKYVEMFYSPGDFWRQGLSVSGITESILRGRERANRDTGILSGLIVDLIRDHGPEIGARRLDEVEPYLGKGLIGIGLGGSEQTFPADPYAPIYREARKRGFRLTAHAGEAAGAESIWTVIKKLGVERIGHGLRAFEDPGLVFYLAEKQIPLEMCVTSNVKTGACPKAAAHPIGDYVQRGLSVTVNSDDPVMFGSSITEEYLFLAQQLGFTMEDLKRLSLNGISASFLTKAEKEEMRSLFEAEWQEILARPFVSTH
ncbi:MAG: adenosine deaminase [Armatimonadetes bacterium]|nr:adenosine deaminase [Armatimonadota bacterium]